VGVEFSPIFIFLGHNFSSGYASKPNKDSKDSDNSLDSKNTWAKKWPIGLAPRAR